MLVLLIKGSLIIFDIFDSTSAITSEQISGELHKGKVYLTASTLLVVKAENIYQNTRKMHITIETEISP